MPKDNELYDILGISPKADAVEIRRAFRSRSLETHPDRPDGNPALFTRLQEAYAVLNDPSKKEAYDRDGYANTKLSLEDAKADFQNSYKGVDILDKEAGDLVVHWTTRATLDGPPDDSLDTGFRGDSENLKKLFHDYSLMASIAGSEEATQNLAAYCGKHFGAQNEQILRGWNKNDQLTPFIDNKYYNHDGDLVPVPKDNVKLKWPLARLMRFHIQYQSYFAALVRGNTPAEKVMGELEDLHRPGYNKIVIQDFPILTDIAKKMDWQLVAKTLEKLKQLPPDAQDTDWQITKSEYSKVARKFGFPTQWSQIVDEELTPHDLKRTPATQSKWKPPTAEEENVAGPSRARAPISYPDLSGKLAAPLTPGPKGGQSPVNEDPDLNPVMHAGDDPGSNGAGRSARSPKGKTVIRPVLSTGADSIMAGRSLPSFKGMGTVRPSSNANGTNNVSGHGRDMGELPDAGDAIFVRNWKQKAFKVFGWRTFGRTEELFLEPEDHEPTTLKILRIEPAAQYRASLASVKQQPKLDLNGKQVLHDDLKLYDLSTLNIVAFAQKTPGIAPESGYPRNTPCYFICKSDTSNDGGYSLATRSDMRRAYGGLVVERMIGEIRQTNSRSLIRLKPMQKHLALQYAMRDTDSDIDSDTDSDTSESPAIRRGTRGAIRHLGSSYRAQTNRRALMIGGRQDEAAAESDARLEGALTMFEELSPTEREIVMSNFPTMTGQHKASIDALSQLRLTDEQEGGRHVAAIDRSLNKALQSQASENQQRYN